METFWSNFSNIVKDINILDNELYIVLYTEIYNYIINLSRIKTMNTNTYPIYFFYNDVRKNLALIFNNKLNNYNIKDLCSYNNSYIDYFNILDKTSNIFTYFDKRVNDYNKNHYIKKLNYYDIGKELWSNFNEQKKGILDKHLTELLNNYRIKSINNILDYHNISSINNLYIYINLKGDEYNNVTNISLEFYNKYLLEIDININSVLSIINTEDTIQNNINYDIKSVISLITDHIINKLNLEDIQFDDLNVLFKMLIKYNLINKLCGFYEDYLDYNICEIKRKGNRIDDICEFYIYNNKIIYDIDNNIDDKIKCIIYNNLVKLVDNDNFGERYAKYLFNLCVADDLNKEYITIIKYIKNNETFQVKFLAYLKNYILKNFTCLSPYIIKNIEKISDTILYYENIDIVFRLKKMIEDVNTSKKIQAVHFNDENNYNILILSNGIWNINYNKTHSKIPNEIIYKNNTLESSYNFIYNKTRNLTHCYDLYTAVVDYNINNTVYTLTLPFNLVNFLCKFNNCNYIEINSEDKVNILLNLKLILKEEDKYVLNQNFKYKKKAINLLNAKHKKKEKKRSTIYNHGDLIQCFIMKWLKQKKCSTYPIIYQNVKKILEMKFIVTDDLFSKNLNKLLELEYIKQEQENYIYN